MIARATNQESIDAAYSSVEFSQISCTWGREPDRERPATARALARDRSRIAADIHDLIMQDVALALATARALADGAEEGSLAAVAVAAGERALAGARRILDELAGGQRELAIEAVEQSVRAAARQQVPLSFDAVGVPDGARLDQPTLQALVHIGREAVTNAIKHAEPFAVEAVLDYEDEWRLRVSDGGRGFDASHAREGFGLQSMRRRAQALGGSLRVHSSPGAGTTVEAILP
jgi:signal transduction histidine kinase